MPRRIFFGSVQTLFELEMNIQSVQSANNFNSSELNDGNDELFLDASIEMNIQSVQSANNVSSSELNDGNDALFHEFSTQSNFSHEPSTSFDIINSFYVSTKDDEIFLGLLNEEERILKFNIPEVRRRCKIQCQKLKFQLRLFDRIPIWVFRYFAASDPCCENTQKCTKLDIMCVFMIINDMKKTAFYKEGGQSYDNCLRLLKFFTTMKKLSAKTAMNSLWTVFGNTFAYHLESRSLRQVDMTFVNNGARRENTEPFIPDNLNWKRERMLRRII